MKKRKASSWIKYTLLVIFVFMFLGSGTLSGIYFLINLSLPKISKLKEYQPPVVTTVFSDDGRKIGVFYKERRIVIPLVKMPDNLINAFVAAEDSRFWDHPGIDLLSILRAFKKNVFAGDIVGGGSTITQQVAKSFLLTPERTYQRKLKEAFLAYRIDKKFTKEEILYLYLNQIYLGHGAYGVEAASQSYFGKQAKDISLAESAMLAGLPPAPSRYSPFKFYNRAKQRQIYVIRRMKEEGYISAMEAAEALAVRIDIHPLKNWFIEKAPYYTEYVRQYVEKKYGKKILYEEGLKIHTTINLDFQQTARTSIQKGLAALDKRIGFRGPIKNIPLSQIEKLCQEEHERLGYSPLRKRVPYQAVVLKIEDNEKRVIVKVGNIQGYIKLDSVTWARKPDSQVAYYNSKVNLVSDIFKPGDVIQVTLLEFGDKPEFTLFQQPIAQSA
ncbi:MAG: transglycosylase domain-containing protein, partial [Desulfobacula sp.]|nr:transglycosylase domain-containing protein [Desulfobacula sp.]